MGSLVSVIIVTYNSSPFVVETLESISSQTWKEIELIITDDCSRDDTLELCNKWVHENKQKFVRTVIITSEENTGVSANANRGLFAAKGDWIKTLGADDTLKPGCIEDNMLWIALHPEIKALFSITEVYRNTIEPNTLIETIPHNVHNPKGIMAPGRSAGSQYRMLLVCDRIHFTPSAILHRETIISLGGFDERFKILEDYPLWLNLTKNGYKLYFFDKITVNYRQHLKAINNTGLSYLINPNYFKSEDFRKLYTYPYLPADIRLNQRYQYFMSNIFRYNWLNKNKEPYKFFLELLTVYLNPLFYFIWLRKRLNKKLMANEFYM